jgi:hypothetical protein
MSRYTTSTKVRLVEKIYSLIDAYDEPLTSVQIYNIFSNEELHDRNLFMNTYRVGQIIRKLRILKLVERFDDDSNHPSKWIIKEAE